MSLSFEFLKNKLLYENNWQFKFFLNAVEYSLGHLEYAQESECAEAGEPERACPGPEVDPDDLEEGASDHRAVEPVEGRGEVGRGAQRVQTYHHFEDKGTKENKFRIN